MFCPWNMFSHMSGPVSRSTRLELHLLYLTRLSNRGSKTPYLSFSMSWRCQPRQILVPVSQTQTSYRIKYSRSRFVSATRGSLLRRGHRTLRMCINLKELAVLSQIRGPGLQDYSSSVYMSDDVPFKLTKFVNDYFIQEAPLSKFIKSQPMLKVLGLHAGETHLDIPYLRGLETFACNMQTPDSELGAIPVFPTAHQNVTTWFSRYIWIKCIASHLHLPPFEELGPISKTKIRWKPVQLNIHLVFNRRKGIEHEASSNSPVSTLARCRCLNAIQVNNLLSIMWWI